MCGFCGFKRSGGLSENDSHLLGRMTASLQRRGPDAEGLSLKNGFALGHRRLSIIDLEGGGQPMATADGRWVIAFNGEIYNYLELKSELEGQGEIFESRSDTEVVLKLVAKRGPDSISRLNGIFAFALADTLTGDLLLARDQFGIKPLYYSQNEKGDLAFGSELKALLPFLGKSATLSKQALDLFLTFEHVPSPHSIFQEIKKLPSGSWLKLTGGKAEVHRYYAPSFTPKEKISSAAEAAEKLDSLFRQAVRRQRISDVPLGAFLSGGLDSSMVTAAMVADGGPRVSTFSIGFEEKSFDESEFAKLVADHLGTKHHCEIFSTQKMLDGLEGVLSYMDEPFADPSLLPTALLSGFARQHVKVALSGDGSDELFGGYPMYPARKVAGLIPRPLGILGSALAERLPTSYRNMSFDFKAKRFFRGFEAADSDLRHQIWLGAFSMRERTELLSSDLQRAIPEPSFISLIHEHMREAEDIRGWERSLWIDFRFYLQDNMFVKVDRASMMHGLEVRVPFLDPDLANFAMHLPASCKISGSKSKVLLREVAAKYLPAEILQRKKKGFGIPLGFWIRGPLRPLFEEYLSEKRIKADGLFRYQSVKRLLDEHLRGAKDHRKQLWPLLVFQFWKEKFNGN